VTPVLLGCRGIDGPVRMPVHSNQARIGGRNVEARGR
jgi:hypothetical protein